MIPLDILTIYSPSITLNSITLFLIYIKQKNKTNHPISSNGHPSATAYKAMRCLK